MVNGAGDLDQRTLSRTLRADGNGCPLWLVESPRGRAVNGLCRELADGDGCPLWEGESPRGRQSKPDMSPRTHD